MLKSGPLIVREVKQHRPRERRSLLVCFLHELHLVVGHLDVDFCELLEEENSIFIVEDLVVVIRRGGRMRTHDHVREGAHFDPSLKQSLASGVGEEKTNWKFWID